MPVGSFFHLREITERIVTEMTKTQTAKRQPPTPGQVIAEQKRRAAKDAAEARATTSDNAVVPAKSADIAVATPDARTDVQKYLDDIAPSGIVGRLIKFSKDGHFVFADTDEPVDEDAEFVALCDQTLIGWIRFHIDGATPPDRVMGLLYDGFQMPARATLGDLDQSTWQAGLSGAPEDPWKHQVCAVLQLTGTGELTTFATISTTGRRAVGNLLRHYDRMQRTNPGELPVVRLRAGGFNHRDERVGWVPTPVFAIVGRSGSQNSRQRHRYDA